MRKQNGYNICIVSFYGSFAADVWHEVYGCAIFSEKEQVNKGRGDLRAFFVRYKKRSILWAKICSVLYVEIGEKTGKNIKFQRKK